MRIFLIAGDIVMGLILGVFLYVALSKTWATLQNPVVGALIVTASVLIVLFRRPGGSFAKRSDERPGK